MYLKIFLGPTVVTFGHSSLRRGRELTGEHRAFRVRFQNDDSFERLSSLKTKSF